MFLIINFIFFCDFIVLLVRKKQSVRIIFLKTDYKYFDEKIKKKEMVDIEQHAT